MLVGGNPGSFALTIWFPIVAVFLKAIVGGFWKMVASSGFPEMVFQCVRSVCFSFLVVLKRWCERSVGGVSG